MSALSRAPGAPAAAWVAFYGLTLAAWAGLALMAAGPAGATADLPAWVLAALCGPAAGQPFATVAAMWGLMAVAMMLPGFAPMLRAYVAIGGAGRGALALVGGFLLVWLALSLGGAAAQAALGRLGLVAPDGRSLSRALTGGLLLLAGAYQFSPLKAACLARCRSPLAFFLGRWRPGSRAAAGMGLHLGLLCAGCCWALMALALVGGTMSLGWMGLATLLMAVEKLPDLGRRLTAPLGAALILAGGATLALAVP